MKSYNSHCNDSKHVKHVITCLTPKNYYSDRETEKKKEDWESGRPKKKDRQTDRRTACDVLPGCDCLLYAAAGAADTCCDVLSR